MEYFTSSPDLPISGQVEKQRAPEGFVSPTAQTSCERKMGLKMSPSPHFELGPEHPPIFNKLDNPH